VGVYAISVAKPAQAKPVEPAKAVRPKKRSMLAPMVASGGALIVVVAVAVWYFRAE